MLIHLELLGPFLSQAVDALRVGGADDPLAIIRRDLTAECVQCRLSLSGDELASLIGQVAAAAGGPKTQRLLQGYCGRNGCDSYYYRLSFLPHPNFDWPEFATAVLDRCAPTLQLVPQSNARIFSWTPVQQWALRGGTMVLAAILLLGLWQWRRGGTIPFLREPEHFQVDAWSGDQSP